MNCLLWTCLLVVLSLVEARRGGSNSVRSSKSPTPQCLYSINVPEVSLEQTCSAFNRQQIDKLKAKVTQLEEKVREYTNVSMTTGPMEASNNPSFHCECQSNTTFKFSFRDCHDVAELIGGTSGWYEVTPVNTTGQLLAYENSPNSMYWLVQTYDPMQVYCHIHQDGSGWTVIMRRLAPMDIDFDRSWNDYKYGFGNLGGEGDFWLGLETIHKLTSQEYTTYMLWVVITDEHQVPYIFPYKKFQVYNEASNYTLHISGYHGYLNDPLGDSDYKPFITKDHDRYVRKSDQEPYIDRQYDRYTGSYTETVHYRAVFSANCPMSNATTGGGGWWFGAYMKSNSSMSDSCGSTNLNAWKPYWPIGGHNNENKAFISVTMMIRPVRDEYDGQ